MNSGSNYSGKMIQDKFGEYPIEANGSFIPQRDAPRGDLINSELGVEISEKRASEGLIQDTLKLIDTLTGELHKFFSLNSGIISNLSISRAKTEYSFEVGGEKIELKFLGFEGYSLNNSEPIDRINIINHLYTHIINIYLKPFGIVFPQARFVGPIISRFIGSTHRITGLGRKLGLSLNNLDTAYVIYSPKGIKINFTKGTQYNAFQEDILRGKEIDFYEFISKMQSS